MVRQLLPILRYASHLWNLKTRKVCKLVDSTWRWVIRKGLGIGYTEFAQCTVGDWFDEASKLMMRQQLLYRAVCTANTAWLWRSPWLLQSHLNYRSLWKKLT